MNVFFSFDTYEMRNGSSINYFDIKLPRSESGLTFLYWVYLASDSKVSEMTAQRWESVTASIDPLVLARGVPWLSFEGTSNSFLNVELVSSRSPFGLYSPLCHLSTVRLARSVSFSSQLSSYQLIRSLFSLIHEIK